jgi:hypothetical protein
MVPPRPAELAFHHYAQDAVDARLIAPAVGLEPVQDVCIQANRQLLFDRRPSHSGLRKEGLPAGDMSEQSVSTSFIRSSLGKPLIIGFLLTAVCLPHGDYAGCFAARCTGYNGYAPGKQAQGDKPILSIIEAAILESDARPR